MLHKLNSGALSGTKYDETSCTTDVAVKRHAVCDIRAGEKALWLLPLLLASENQEQPHREMQCACMRTRGFL